MYQKICTRAFFFYLKMIILLKGNKITAIGWNKHSNERTTDAILVGTKKGSVFELCVNTNNESFLNTTIDTYCKLVRHDVVFFSKSELDSLLKMGHICYVIYVALNVDQTQIDLNGADINNREYFFFKMYTWLFFHDNSFLFELLIIFCNTFGGCQTVVQLLRGFIESVILFLF